MSWIRGSSTDYIDFSNDLVTIATGNSLATATVNAGGTGYTVGDILTVSGGTFSIAAQLEVLTVSAGVITAIRRFNDGAYTVNPSTPVSVTGGTGTGATFNVTFVNNGWISRRNQTYSGSNREVILEGTGAGANQIFIGWRTFHDTPGGWFNLELHGMTGFNSLLPFVDQPGLSPGEFDGTTGAERAGPYLLANNASFSFWLNITPFRIIGVIKPGSAYFPFYMGWGNRFATSSQYPYPMIIAGNSSTPFAPFNQGTQTSGIPDPLRSTSADGNTRSCMLIFNTDNQWYEVANGTVSASARTALFDRVVVPTGRPDGATSAALVDRFCATNHDFTNIIRNNVLSGAATANLHPTPNIAGNLRILLPTMVVFSTPSVQILAEIDDVFWVSAFGGVVSEDRLLIGTDVYRVFQNCNRTENYSFLAIKEL